MSFSLDQILGWSSGRVVHSGASAFALRLERLAQLAGSQGGDICFFFSREYEAELPRARPSVLITAPPFVAPLAASGLPLLKTSVIVACDDPYSALALLSAKFDQGRSLPGPELLNNQTFIDPRASIDPQAQVGAQCWVGAGASVGAGAIIGARSRISEGVSVGRGVVLGEDCAIFPHVTLYPGTRVGSRTRIHAGTVIGADGFGYAPLRSGNGVIGHQKIYHLGGVSIGDDVEIGANCCVDRGTLGDTVLEDQVKIDNLTQIGHNCRVGRGTVLCGQVGLAGRSSTGAFVTVGGKSGLTNAVHVGDGAQIAGFSGVSKDVTPGSNLMGMPARHSVKEFYKFQAFLSRLYERAQKEKSKD